MTRVSFQFSEGGKVTGKLRITQLSNDDTQTNLIFYSFVVFYGYIFVQFFKVFSHLNRIRLKQDNFNLILVIQGKVPVCVKIRILSLFTCSCYAWPGCYFWYMVLSEAFRTC